MQNVLLSIFVMMMGSLFLSGCAVSKGPAPGQVTQWGVYRPNASGVGKPMLTVQEALRYGDTGIGYLSPLDGELVFEQGKVFQARADGQIHNPPGTAALSVALICRFQLDQAERLADGLNRQALETELSKRVLDEKSPLAFRIIGRFEQVETTAPAPARSPTGLPRIRQNVYHRVSGVITGFRLSNAKPGLHPKGLHMIFISHDRLNGGRVTDFKLLDGTLEIHFPNRFFWFAPH